jgi:hypothetical protein
LSSTDKFIDDIISEILKYKEEKEEDLTFSYVVKIQDKEGNEKSLNGLYYMDIDKNTLILKEK